MKCNKVGCNNEATHHTKIPIGDGLVVDAWFCDIHYKEGYVVKELYARTATLQSESIKLSVSLSKNTFKLSEKINLNVTITNISNKTILLAYLLPPKVDFVVYDNSSRIIFTFSKSIELIETEVSLFLEPSESYNKRLEWDQLTEEEGEFLPVDSGIYYITGRTGPGLCYLGSLDDYRDDRDDFEERIAFETPKIEIQIQ